MRYRVFAPLSAVFNDVYRPMDNRVEIVEMGRQRACNAPLRNRNHERCYVAECHQRDRRRRPVSPKTVLDPLNIRPWDEIGVVTQGQRGMRYLEAFPPVAGESATRVVDALGEQFTGTIRRGSYPVTNGQSYREDAQMWVFKGRPEVADRFREVLDGCYRGVFALATEDDEPVCMF
jgi:hypothetical protein